MDHLNKLYVGLDTILDLRLGTMIMVSPEFAYAVSTQPNYFQREEDSFESTDLDPKTGRAFGKLGLEVVEQLQHKHAQAVVRNSLKTKMARFVRQLCAVHWRNVIREGQEIAVSIDVNVYPYVFTDEEVSDLRLTLANFFGKPFTVNLIDLSWQRLTIDHVRETYFAMVMYNYAPWVNLHDTAIRKKPLRETTVFVPRLYFGGRPAEEHLKDFERNNLDPFQRNAEVVAPLIPIQYLPVAFFCADTEENLAEYTAPSVAAA